MANDDKVNDDQDLFRQTVGQIRRLKHNKAHHDDTPRPDANPRQFIADEEQVKHDLLSDNYVSSELQPGDILNYHQGGLQRNVLRKLRRGEFRCDAVLDLHGMTSAEARQALVAFLNNAAREDFRSLRIIHGKGLRSSNQGPVLKGLVNNWLQQRSEVLAFHSARPEDGGTGAVYVLLKSTKP